MASLFGSFCPKSEKTIRPEIAGRFQNKGEWGAGGAGFCLHPRCWYALNPDHQSNLPQVSAIPGKIVAYPQRNGKRRPRYEHQHGLGQNGQKKGTRMFNTTAGTSAGRCARSGPPGWGRLGDSLTVEDRRVARRTGLDFGVSHLRTPVFSQDGIRGGAGDRASSRPRRVAKSGTKRTPPLISTQHPTRRRRDAAPDR